MQTSTSSEVLTTSASSCELLELTPDQQNAVTALYETNCLVVGKMGSGKTVVAATAITELLDDKQVQRVLIVTTPKIANTVWAQEFAKWSHTQHVPVAVATGSPEERLALMKSDAPVCVITFNNLPWAKKEKLFGLFDGLLVDETTKLKETGGAWFKAIRPHLKKFVWRGGLTGTPVNEDFMGLFGQMMLVDAGASLGTRKEAFLARYFYALDYKQYNWALKEGAEAQLLQAISPHVHVMPEYRGELPPIEYHQVPLTMPGTLAAYYDQMRRDMVTEDTVSQTAAVLVQKLQQIGSGFVYDEAGDAVQLSDYRVDALRELLERLKGQNVIIAYWYKEDLQRLRAALPDAHELNPKTLAKTVKRWNAGEIEHLLIHPRSAGHGLQLEQGGYTIIWYSPVWSNDLWEQTNARVWRRGQKHPVHIYTLEAVGTIDELISQRVEMKAQFDKLFTQHLGAAQ